jgi:hypothetical protein
VAKVKQHTSVVERFPDATGLKVNFFDATRLKAGQFVVCRAGRAGIVLRADQHIALIFWLTFNKIVEYDKNENIARLILEGLQIYGE